MHEFEIEIEIVIWWFGERVKFDQLGLRSERNQRLIICDPNTPGRFPYCCLVFCSKVLFSSLTSSFYSSDKHKKRSQNGKREKRRRSSERSSSSSGQQIAATHWVREFGCNGKKKASDHSHRQIQNNRTPHCECPSKSPPPPHSHLRHLRFPSSPLRPILSVRSIPGKCKTASVSLLSSFLLSLH